MTTIESTHTVEEFLAIGMNPAAFAAPQILRSTLRGAEVLYNTYWVRFNHRTFTFQDAVRNTQTLFAAAKAAGVRRVVHVSITNPDPVGQPSRLEYFRGKGILEKSLADSGLSHAILRPAVIFGMEDILVNNIAWVLRRFPFFGGAGWADELQPALRRHPNLEGSRFRALASLLAHQRMLRVTKS